MTDVAQYRPGSFIGVELNISSQTVEVPARRGPLHQYVDEAEPYFEDTGKTPRRVTVSAYFRGSDHLIRARALERAVGLEGGGLLVLPSRVTMNAVCISCIRSEELETLKNETRFDLEFVPSNPFRLPGSVLNSIIQVLETLADAVAVVQTVVRLPRLVLSTLDATVKSAFTQLGLTTTPSSSLSDVTNNLTRLEDYPDTVAAVSVALQLGSYETEPRPIDRVSASDLQLFEAEFRVVATLQAIKLTKDLTFTNRLEATRIRDTIEDNLLADLELLSDQAQVTLLEVRRAHLVDFQQRILTLPTFRVVDTVVSLPSVVAAHRYLGDWRRETDLRVWNTVEHPLFMPTNLDILG